MDIKKMNLEIELLRTIKPIANEANLALKEIAKSLREIHEINELTPSEKWKQFQKDTYEDLQRIEKISTEYEERKQRLIQKNHLTNNNLELDSKTRIEFDKGANVVKIFKEGIVSEIM